MTTFEPGAKLVFTQGFELSPRSTAFFASRPAPSISDGFEVLVQLVMAAITTEPSARSKLSPLFFTLDVLWRGACQRFFEGRFRLRERNAVLRTLWSGHCGDDFREVEFQAVGENRIGSLVGAEEALFFRVGFDEADLLFAAAGEAKIRERFCVDGEEAHRRAIFGRHIRDRGAVGKSEAREAGAVELDEFSDDAFFAQNFGDGKDEVGGRGAFRQTAMEFESDDSWNQHRERLAEHSRFRFDAADAPAEDAEAIDHRGVRIGADERIGESEPGAVFLFFENDAGEIFEIHLVADAGVRRDDFEILKTFLAPAQERVTLDVALHFEIGVEKEGVGSAELVHLHGMVDDEFGGKQRINFLWIAAELAHRVAHGGKIDDGRDAREILKQNASGHEGNFFFAGAFGAGGIPGGEGANIVGMNEAAVFVAQEVFEENFQREGKARGLAYAGALERVEAVNFEGFAAYFESGAGGERVFVRWAHAGLESPV